MSNIPHIEQLLRLLKDSDGYISGETIARQLKVSRAAVWKQIAKLRKDGFAIDALPRIGYRLLRRPDKLIPVEIKDGLNTTFIGQEIFYYPKTESTNLIAKKTVMDGAEEGTVIIAEEQSMGRGRLDRKWLSPAGKNILLSIIFRPKIQHAKVFYLTMLTSLAIVKAIKKSIALDALIKWPNDIYIGNKKTGGLLTEFNADQDRVSYVIVGIGLNVNFDPFIYNEIRDNATSLSIELGKKISRIKLLRSILEEIEIHYNAFNKNKSPEIHKQWLRYSLILGKPVKIISFNSVCEGIAESIDDDGCLILRYGKNKKKKILSGDVSLRF